MLNRLTNKQKLRLTGLLALVVLLLCYELAVRRTVAEYARYQAMRTETENLRTNGNSFQALQNREEVLNSLLGRYLLDTLQPPRNLLTVVSNYCQENSLLLKEYKPLSLSRTDSMEVLTRSVTVEGAFIPCLKLLYELERSGETGKTSSADFRSYIDPQDKKLRLTCTMYIQNLVAEGSGNNGSGRTEAVNTANH